MQASPSKARAQAAETHSWSMVLSWLSNLYHPSPLPAFERNSSMLKTLQSLMAESLAADRLQELLFEAKVEELCVAGENQRTRQQDASGASLGILDLLEDSLTAPAKEALESIATSAVLLGSCSPEDREILQSLPAQAISLSRQIFTAEDHVASVESLTSHLHLQTSQTTQHLSALRENISALSARGDKQAHSPPATPPADHPGSAADYSHLHAQTLQHQRETRQLELKAVEYKARREALETRLKTTPASLSAASLSSLLVAQQRALEEKRKHVNVLESRFKAFHGLPPDVEASRREVQRAQGELDTLKRKRDGLFERL